MIERREGEAKWKTIHGASGGGHMTSASLPTGVAAAVIAAAVASTTTV